MTLAYKIVIVVFAVIWVGLLLNGWGEFHGHIMFENLRLQGITFFVWLIIPWLCLLIVFLSRPPLLSTLLAIVLVPVFGLITLLSFDDAMDLVRTGKDRTMSELQRQRIDANTSHVFYDYNCGPVIWGGLVERTETEIMPGLLMVAGASKVRS